jgi:hypothetical protein
MPTCRAGHERLDAALGHMRTIGAHASGAHGPGSVLTVIADAAEDFKPATGAQHP